VLCSVLIKIISNFPKFVAAGGLQQLLEIFNSGILEPKEQESWTVQKAIGKELGLVNQERLLVIMPRVFIYQD